MSRRQLEEVKRWEQPLYPLWINMRARCKHHHNYKDRGIVVCEEWNDYPTFRTYIEENLGEKPSPKHSLDRINNDGNYEPGNVRWATPSQQMRNTRMEKRSEHFRKVAYANMERKLAARLALLENK